MTEPSHDDVEQQFDQDPIGRAFQRAARSAMASVEPSDELLASLDDLGRRPATERLSWWPAPARVVGLAVAVIVVGTAGLLLLNRSSEPVPTAAEGDESATEVDEAPADTTSPPPTPTVPSTSRPTTSPDTDDQAASGDADDADEPGGQPDGPAFVETFDEPAALDRFETRLIHSDSLNITQTEWPGDYGPPEADGSCPELPATRTITRGQPIDGSTDWELDDGWIYTCAPGGDAGRGQLLTAIGDTSGFSIGAFSPRQSFEGVTEIRWRANQTDLGSRQRIGLAIVPVDAFDFENLPCTGCEIGVDARSIGATEASWGGGRSTRFIRSDQGGFREFFGPRGYECDSCSTPFRNFGMDYGIGDPALDSVEILRQNILTDNGDGTITWAFELADGQFDEVTMPGSFPDGPVRVVFMDINFTPNKDGVPTSYTWHWDDITVLE